MTNKKQNKMDDAFYEYEIESEEYSTIMKLLIKKKMCKPCAHNTIREIFESGYKKGIKNN